MGRKPRARAAAAERQDARRAGPAMAWHVRIAVGPAGGAPGLPVRHFALTADLLPRWKPGNQE
jgi:hypothetical protein